MEGNAAQGCVCTCMRTCTRTCVWVQCMYVRVHTHACGWVHVCVCTRGYVCAGAGLCVHVCAHVYG